MRKGHLCLLPDSRKYGLRPRFQSAIRMPPSLAQRRQVQWRELAPTFYNELKEYAIRPLDQGRSESQGLKLKWLGDDLNALGLHVGDKFIQVPIDLAQVYLQVLDIT